MSNSLQPHGLQHARPPCLSPTPRVYSNPCPLSWWCHAIQPSHPLSSPSPPTFNLSQHQDLFKIGKGVYQGCILSPCLFNFDAEYIMRNAGLDEAQARIKIAGQNINTKKNKCVFFLMTTTLSRKFLIKHICLDRLSHFNKRTQTWVECATDYVYCIKTKFLLFNKHDIAFGSEDFL